MNPAGAGGSTNSATNSGLGSESQFAGGGFGGVAHPIRIRLSVCDCV